MFMTAQLTLIKVYLRLILALLGFLITSIPAAKANGAELTSYGHSSILIKGEGKKILLNPFKSFGCTEGLKEPNLKVNVILASSQLADEGYRVANGLFLFEPGSYRIGKLRIEGFPVDHDRLGGRRFGQGVVWQWEQSGLSFAHLGGVAAPLNQQEKILLGRPDVLFIAVGGGPKVYNPQEAVNVIKDLNPKRIIPVQYLTKFSSKECELKPIQSFLDLMADTKVKKVGNTYTFPRSISDDLQIILFE